MVFWGITVIRERLRVLFWVGFGSWGRKLVVGSGGDVLESSFGFMEIKGLVILRLDGRGYFLRRC